MSTQPKPWYTPEEYLALERGSETKHEYFDGEVFAMGGASERQVSIASNLVIELGSQLKGRPCKVYSADMRVKVSATGLYTYPDVIVVCGQRHFDDRQQDTLLNPKVIIEVLSASTEAYDRGKKFAHYRTLDSLAEYLLVVQDAPRVEQYIRQPDDDWLLHAVTRPEDSIGLTSIGCRVKLADVYDKIEFTESADPPASE